MKRRYCALVVSLLANIFLYTSAAAQSSPQPSLSPGDALARAVENEAKLKSAEGDFSYHVEIRVRTFGEAGSVTGQLHRVSEMTYDDLGNRTEKILEYPPSRLSLLIGTLKPDFKSLVGVDPFFLTADQLPLYTIRFVERQKIDELNTYAFDVEPIEQKWPAKRKEQGEFPFKGRIWIDDQDFQIVKMEGRATTTKKDSQRFRENVDGRHWLPSFVYAKDVLDMPRFDLPIEIQIKYTGYRHRQARR